MIEMYIYIDQKLLNETLKCNLLISFILKNLINDLDVHLFFKL